MHVLQRNWFNIMPANRDLCDEVMVFKAATPAGRLVLNKGDLVYIENTTLLNAPRGCSFNEHDIIYVNKETLLFKIDISLCLSECKVLFF